jgi:serine protease AprX
MRRAGIVAGLVAAGVLGGSPAPRAGAGPAARAEDAPPPAPVETGHWMRARPGGAVYRLAREGRRKVWIAPDGRVLPSFREVVLEEFADRDPIRDALHPDLRAAAFDPARAAERVRVNLRFGVRPSHAAASEAWIRFSPRFDAALAPARAALDRIAPALPAATDGPEALRERMEAEAALLAPAERDALRLAAVEVAALREEFREAVRGASAPAAGAMLAPVREWLESRDGVRVLAESPTLPTLTVGMPAGLLVPLLEAHPGVSRISPVSRYTTGMNTSVGTVGASNWWNAGFNGSTLTEVGILDTGIDSSHPALSANVTDEGVYLAYNFYYDYYTTYADAYTTDDYDGHGTHVAGTVGSTNATYSGVAPGTSLVTAKCGSGHGSFFDPDIFNAGDFAVGVGAAALNCSFGGYGSNGESDLTHFFDAVTFDLLTLVAIAAGNSGPGSNTVGTPGDLYNGISVANFDDNGTTTHSDNSLSSSSSRGPTDDGRSKPDLAAPGEDITSCNTFWASSADFITFSGTSMACPHVAGSAALLYDAASSWSPAGIKALLLNTVRNTAPYNTSPDYGFGHGGLDLAAAFAARATVREASLTATGPRYLLFRSGALSSGGRVTLAWNRQVFSNGTSPPILVRDISDLDLFVFDEADGDLVASSEGVENTEQAKVGAAVATPLIKVYRYDTTFPTGVTVEPFALATGATTSTAAVTPPALSCGFTGLPSGVAAGSEFEVVVTVANAGGAAAQAGIITLSPPAGFAVVGAEATVLPRIAGNSSVQVSWTVQAPSGSGSGAFSVDASSTSYDETFETGATSGTIASLSSPPPEVTGLSATAFSSSRIDLAWTDASAEETSFEFERRLEGGAFAALAPSSAANTVARSDTGLLAGRRYGYRIRAVNALGPSDWSAEVAAVTTPSLTLTLQKGLVTDSPKPAKDKFQAKGTLAFNAGSPDQALDPTSESLLILFGHPGAETSIAAAAGHPGWSVLKGGKLRWKSPKGAVPKVTLDLDTVKGKFLLKVASADLAALPEGSVAVRVQLGDDAVHDIRSWRASGSGKFKFP